MGLINILNMDVKDILYQFNVLFPKAPVHTEEERREREKRLVLKYLHRDGEMVDNYVTTEDIEKRKEELRGYNFLNSR